MPVFSPVCQTPLLSAGSGVQLAFVARGVIPREEKGAAPDAVSRPLLPFLSFEACHAHALTPGLTGKTQKTGLRRLHAALSCPTSRSVSVTGEGSRVTSQSGLCLHRPADPDLPLSRPPAARPPQHLPSSASLLPEPVLPSPSELSPGYCALCRQSRGAVVATDPGPRAEWAWSSPPHRRLACALLPSSGARPWPSQLHDWARGQVEGRWLDSRLTLPLQWHPCPLPSHRSTSVSSVSPFSASWC